MRFGSIVKQNRNFNRSGTNEFVLSAFVSFVTIFVEHFLYHFRVGRALKTQGNFEQTIRNLEFSFSFESPTHHNNDDNIAMLCFA